MVGGGSQRTAQVCAVIGLRRALDRQALGSAFCKLRTSAARATRGPNLGDGARFSGAITASDQPERLSKVRAAPKRRVPIAILQKIGGEAVFATEGVQLGWPKARHPGLCHQLKTGQIGSVAGSGFERLCDRWRSRECLRDIEKEQP